MSSGADLRERAIRALAAIRADPSDRAAFERVYSGPGDALEVLETFTESSDRVAAARATLRAIAFGRIDSPDDEAGASRARRSLDEMDAAESARAIALADALTAFEAGRPDAAHETTRTNHAPAGVPPDGAAIPTAEPDPGAPDAPRRRVRPVLLAVASFAAGVALASAVAVATTITMQAGSAPGSTSAPRTTALREDPSGIERGLIERAHASSTGSVDAAEGLFSRPATARDRVTGFMPVDVVADSTRRLFGAGSTVVYAARNTADEYCLLVLRGSITTSRCTDTAGFARSGLYTGGASEDGTSDVSFAVRWDGTIVEIISAG